MSKESKKSAITIDGTQYALEDLSANARSQIVNLRVTDHRKIGDRPRFPENRGQTTVSSNPLPQSAPAA